jgi:ABC-type lipoprotein export system ATPase subunit
MSASAAPRVELAGVSRTYAEGGAEEVRALRGVDLTLPAGGFVSVEGPSGCGKTTLLNLVGLLDTPTAGEVRWDGRPVGLRTDRERSRLRLETVGFIFQRFYLLPTLTAAENVELPMRALGRPRPERRARAVQLLRAVGLEERARAYPHQLSGGEEQRVAIARAVANDPGLLLADEPTGELDSASAGVVLDLLARLRAERAATLILVTHNPEVAARASRHLTLRDGRLVADRKEA